MRLTISYILKFEERKLTMYFLIKFEERKFTMCIVFEVEKESLQCESWLELKRKQNYVLRFFNVKR